MRILLFAMRKQPTAVWQHAITVWELLLYIIWKGLIAIGDEFLLVTVLYNRSVAMSSLEITKHWSDGLLMDACNDNLTATKLQTTLRSFRIWDSWEQQIWPCSKDLSLHASHIIADFNLCYKINNLPVCYNFRVPMLQILSITTMIYLK